MPTNYKNILLKMGFTEEHLPKEDETIDEQIVADKLGGMIKTALHNDNAFLSEIKTKIDPEIRGAITGEYKRKLNKELDLGLANDGKDLKIEDVVVAAKTKMTSLGSATAQELQRKFTDKETELNGQITSLNEKLTAQDNGFKKQRKLDSFFGFVKQTIAKEQKDLSSSADALFPFVKDKLQEGWDLTEDGDKVTLLAKGGGGTRYKEGQTIFTDEAIIKKVLTDEKLYKEKKVINPNKGGATVVDEEDGSGKTKTVKYGSEGLNRSNEKKNKADAGAS